MDIVIPDDWMIVAILVLLGVLLALVVIWAVRHPRSGTRRMEIELEREKLDILKRDMARTAHPFSRLSPDKLAGLRALEEENDSLELDIYASQQTVEARIRRLENRVKQAKLARMIKKIDDEEQKIG
jgi:hypothetical protein